LKGKYYFFILGTPLLVQLLVVRNSLDPVQVRRLWLQCNKLMKTPSQHLLSLGVAFEIDLAKGSGDEKQNRCLISFAVIQLENFAPGNAPLNERNLMMINNTSISVRKK